MQFSSAILSHVSITDYLSPQIVNSPLHNAVLSDDVVLLKELISSKLYDVNVSDDNGRTPLIYSIFIGSFVCFDILLNNGADLYSLDVQNMNPLHWACQIGLSKIVKALIANNCDLYQKDAQGRIPLHYTTLHHDPKVIHILIKKMNRSSIDEGDSLGMSALHWAAYHNNHSACRFLIHNHSNPGNTDNEGRTPLHLCSGNKDIMSIKVLVELAGSTLLTLQDFQGCTLLHHIVAFQNFTLLTALTDSTNLPEIKALNLDSKDLEHRTALHWAFAFGYATIADVLLTLGASFEIFDGNGYLPLHYAVERNFVDCIDCFFSHKNVADLPDKGNRTSLMLSCQIGHFESTRVILERNTISIDYSTSITGLTALHYAALGGNLLCMKLLLKYGAEINSKDINGRTPLSYASERGYSESVKLLFSSGGTINISSNDGRIPLHYVALAHNLATNDFIISRSSVLSPKDDFGRIPFHYAASCDNVIALKLLGIDSINFQDKTGYSALHFAIIHGSENSVNFLISNGAKLNQMDFSNERRTPLDLAIYFEKHNIISILQNSGCVSGQEIITLAVVEIQRFWRKTNRLGKKRMQANLSSIQEFDFKKNIEDPTFQDNVLTIKPRDVYIPLTLPTKITYVPASPKDEYKTRKEIFTKKTEAVLILQLWWRRYLRKLHYRKKSRKEENAVEIIKKNERERELAALLIQLTWRQYVRRKLLASRINCQKKVFHWSPAVMATRQRFILEKLYSQSIYPNYYTPGKLVPLERPCYTKFIASPAALSFNFALNQYSSM